MQARVDVLVAALAESAVDAERRLDVARLLHVDADEIADARRVPDELGNVALRKLLVDRETEVRELERDVRAQALRADAVEQLAVGGHHLPRLGLVAHALAEERRVREEPLVVQPPQDRDGGVETLPRDEARCAELEAVALHEPLQPRAVRGREDQAAEHAHACQAATIRSTSSCSASLRPRRGVQTSAVTGTPRSPRAVFDAAWNGSRLSDARSARAFSPSSADGARTRGTTASGKLAASPETAPAAPAASPSTSSASAPTNTSSPSRR